MHLTDMAAPVLSTMPGARAHSTPDPDVPPASEPVPVTPPAVPVPDDVPDPAHAPVVEPGMPSQPIRTASR